MKSLMRWMGFSLRRKLSFIMVISTLVPLLFLGVFTYLISSSITEQKLKQAGFDTLRQMENNLRFIVSDLENMSISLIGQSDIQQYLAGPDDNEMQKNRILGFMTNLASSKSYISNITIYHREGPDSYMSTATIYESGLAGKLDIREVKEKLWTDVYPLLDYSGEHNVISFIRPIRNIYAYKDIIGWLSISLDEEVISRYWSEPHLGDGRGQVALLNSEGKIISATEKSWLNEAFDDLFTGTAETIRDGEHGEFTFGEGEEKRTILYYPQALTGWTLVGTIPYDLYRSQNGYILQLTAAAVVITILIVVGSILFVVQRVTNPLRILTRLLTKVNPDGPMPLFHTSSGDEIGRLGASYNMLGQHIKQLKEQLIQDETRKKEADIRALQAQINPHFLYNTLSSIHWMALMRDEKQIADMVGALSDFLQFSLNKGNDYCPVHQEIAHIRNYIQVQQIRYPDKFDIDIVVDTGVQDKFMLKLLLQPLLENAMIHGIQKKADKGTIAVYLELKGNRMNFLVIDDGVGMTDDQLASLRGSIYHTDSKFAGLSGYGLRNVNERLRLHYGPDSCLHIESRPNSGTRISFSIPILEGHNENSDLG